MSRFIQFSPRNGAPTNANTIKTRNDEENNDENDSSSKPQHRLASFVPARTLEQRRPMPSQASRQFSEESGQSFVPSLSTVTESSEEDASGFISNEIINSTAINETKRHKGTGGISKAALAHVERLQEPMQKSCKNAKPPSARALNLLRYAASGDNYFPDIPHPEIEALASVLIEFRHEERLALLKPLSNELRGHMSRQQNIKVSDALDYLDAAGTSKHDQSLLNSRLRRFQKILGGLIHEVETSISDFAPGSAAELAEKARTLITTNTDKEENGTARAIKLIYCAAGGNIYVNPKQPETGACAKGLRDLSNNDRREYLQLLYSTLKSYLTEAQRTMIENHNSSITDTTRKKGNNLEYSDFLNLRQALQEELTSLDVKIPPFS